MTEARFVSVIVSGVPAVTVPLFSSSGTITSSVCTGRKPSAKLPTLVVRKPMKFFCLISAAYTCV
ncbi:hypothetical protein [Amycolatopsis sp. NBC_00438]|uniref:hypothetical protein n=1 Tax=Amycolatopsis sp. NBC_00438 TaxID=2903558 RepID=UPI002E1B3160